jgi:hypothetical protein
MLELNDTLRALCIARNDLVVCSTEQNQRIEALEAAPAFRVLETGERIQMNIVQDKLDRLIALDAADPTPDPAITVLRAASAEAQPGGLVERVANAISEGDEPDKWHPEARDAICEVATWLDRFALHGSGEYAQAAKVLRQEANHG